MSHILEQALAEPAPTWWNEPDIYSVNSKLELLALVGGRDKNLALNNQPTLIVFWSWENNHVIDMFI
jgi:hypothetical protein